MKRASSNEYDESRALALFRQACDAGDAFGCGRLGHLYQTGTFKNELSAIKFFRRGCDGGDLNSCGVLSTLGVPLSFSPPSVPADPKDLERACQGGDMCRCLAKKLTPGIQPTVASGVRRRCRE